MIIVKSGDNIKQCHHSVIKTQGNNFKGWKCYSGFDFLWINRQGDVYGNVCKHSGKYGNLYSDITLPSDPIVCPASNCYCASDIEIPKTKNTSLSIVNKNVPVIESIRELDEIIGIEKIGSNALFSINWNIGRRCNYDCSYCPSTVHDNFSQHLTFKNFKKGFDSIYSQIKLPRVKITFTGGEPTINPYYKEIVSYCRSKENVTVHTNTNGTANKNKLLWLTEQGGTHISVHQEFTNLNKLYDKLKYIAYNKTSQSTCVLKMMLIPGTDPGVIDFISKVKEINTDNFYINIEPLVDKSNNNKIYDYTEQELRFIRTKEWTT